MSLRHRDGRLWAPGGVLLLVATLIGAHVVAAQALPPEAPAIGEVTMLTDDPNGNDPQSVPDAATSDARTTAATLSGQILIGPTCPVVRLDRLEQCQDQPYAATLSIRTADDAEHEVMQVISDPQGRFSVDVDPGTYRIVPLGVPGRILPRGLPLTVTVVSGVASTVVVHYDSGMR